MEIKFKDIKRQEKLNVCVFCGDEHEICTSILKNHLCNKCIDELTALDVNDYKYDFYKDIIKNKIVKKLKY